MARATSPTRPMGNRLLFGKRIPGGGGKRWGIEFFDPLSSSPAKKAAALRWPKPLNRDSQLAIPRLRLREKDFSAFLGKKKKSARTVSNYAEFVRQYEAYLQKHKKGKKIGATVQEDLKDFTSWADSKRLKTNQYLWGIKEYFEFISKPEMKLAVDAMIGARYLSRFKLGDFLGIKPHHIDLLEKEGIVTAKDMLYAGLTEQKRLAISRRTGIPPDDVLELVKLSDQARIGGHKTVRARLYHDAGFDTIDKIAACDAAELRYALGNWIQKTGFKGIPPTPGEAQHTVTMARYLERLAEY